MFPNIFYRRRRGDNSGRMISFKTAVSIKWDYKNDCFFITANLKMNNQQNMMKLMMKLDNS